MKILNLIDLINFIKRIAPHKKKMEMLYFQFQCRPLFPFD